MTRARRHLYACPSCGREVAAVAAHHARQQTPCRPCTRVRNGWACGTCGTTDPEHTYPCPATDRQERTR